MSRTTTLVAGLMIGLLSLVPAVKAASPTAKKPSKAQQRKAEKAAAMQEMIVRADAGDPEAMTIVGSCCLKGKNVEKDPARGMRYLESASAKGWKEADVMLLDIYKNGRYGIAKDPAKAEALYTKLGIASPDKQKAAMGEMKKSFDAFLASDDERAQYINKAKGLGKDADLKVIASMVIEGTRLMEKAHGQHPVDGKPATGGDASGTIATQTNP